MSPYQNDMQSLTHRTPQPGSGCHQIHEPGLPAQGGAVGRVGIIGANAVGIDIAMSLLDAGVPVTLLELDRTSLDSGLALARSGYRNAVAKGEIGLDESGRRMAGLTGTVYFHHLKDCDLIVDALPTDTLGKEKLFRRLDQSARSGAVLVTHASDVRVDHIAGCTRRHGDVLGLHITGSSETGEAWRIVPGKDTSSATLGTVIALGGRLRKAVVVGGVCEDTAIGGKSAAGQVDGVASWKIDQALE
jgi:3-hydroxyacyl-CoA dehydrogenase